MQRKSKQKESILRVVKETSSHPTAEWVYEQVKRQIPNISLGTVYRNLKLLKQTGDISELGAAGTLSRFDGNTQNHYHFRCEQCGRLFDVDEPINKTMDNRVAQKTGFIVTYHYLEFRGVCNDCQHPDSPADDS
jgi:Fur family peroxide stress response transcriptional regulator